MTARPVPIPSQAPARYQTAADWVHALGDIPLERIIFDPWPGTATEEDLLRKVEVEDRLCELVEGTLVEKPMGWRESLIAVRLIKLLSIFIDARKLGVVTGGDGPIRFGEGLVRLPDVAFVSFGRMPGGRIPKESILSLAPDLAVEVLSKGNTSGEMRRKVGEYFRAGVGEVWLIDPRKRSAVVYRSPDGDAQHVEAVGTLHGAGVLDGLKISMRELFEGLD